MVLGVDTHLHTHAAVALDQLGRRLGELAWKRVCDPVPRSKILGAMDLREISARGMEVGAHSMTHVVLSGIEPEVLEREVNHTRYVLSEVLGEKVEGFSYPLRDPGQYGGRSCAQSWVCLRL